MSAPVQSDTLHVHPLHCPVGRVASGTPDRRGTAGALTGNESAYCRIPYRTVRTASMAIRSLTLSARS